MPDVGGLDHGKIYLHLGGEDPVNLFASEAPEIPQDDPTEKVALGQMWYNPK